MRALAAPRRWQPDLRVLVVEHETILREGLPGLIELQPGLTVAATATDIEHGLRAIRRLRPHIVVADGRLPNQGAFFLTRAVRRELPTTGVVLLVSQFEPVTVALAREAGASALITERIASTELGTVLRGAAAAQGDGAPTVSGEDFVEPDRQPDGGGRPTWLA